MNMVDTVKSQWQAKHKGSRSLDLYCLSIINQPGRETSFKNTISGVI